MTFCLSQIVPPYLKRCRELTSHCHARANASKKGRHLNKVCSTKSASSGNMEKRNACKHARLRLATDFSTRSIIG
eukprot:1728459-Amphidinium_carterae.1